jgi:hypothetical protein
MSWVVQQPNTSSSHAWLSLKKLFAFVFSFSNACMRWSYLDEVQL